MDKRKNTENILEGIPELQLESLARVLLEPCRRYLSSEQGKKDYAEWEKERQKDNNDLRNV